MEAKIKRKRVNWRRLTTVLAILIVSFMTGYGAMAYFMTGESIIPSGDNSTAGTYQPGKRVTLLLLGTDARPGEKDSRTDSIIVASIDPAEKKAALVSIPRDTLVDLPGHGRDKINSANVFGGPELTKETVEKLMDIKIDYYMKTNFEGFRDIIETLGGVTIDVEKDMRYYDPTDGTNINLKKGVQRLTGKTALDYARFRHDSLGDISRTQRQQKLLKAVARETLQAKTVFKLPTLIPQIAKAVDTDLSLPEMIKLARMAKDMENIQLVTQTLPGQFYNNHGSYWKVDEEKAKVVLDNMLKGVSSEVVIGPDINVAKKVTRTAKAELKKKPAPDQTTDPSQPPEQPKPEPDSVSQDGNNSGSSTTDGTPNPDVPQDTGGPDQGNNGGDNQNGNSPSDQQGANQGEASGLDKQPGATQPPTSNGSAGGATSDPGSAGTSELGNNGLPPMPSQPGGA